MANMVTVRSVAVEHQNKWECGHWHLIHIPIEDSSAAQGLQWRMAKMED